MLSSSFTCPQCSTTLKTAQPLPAGRLVRCPRCGTTFPAGEMPTAEADPFSQTEPIRRAAALSPVPRPLPPPGGFRGDDEFDPEGRSTYSRSRKQSKSGLVWTLAFVGLLLVAGGAYLAYYFFVQDRTNAIPAAQMEALRFVPAENGVLVGVDMANILAEPEVKRLVEKFPKQLGGLDFGEEHKKNTGLSADEIDHMALGANIPFAELIKMRKAGGPPDLDVFKRGMRGVAVTKTKTSVNREQVLKNMGAGDARQLDGKTYYPLPAGHQHSFVFFPGDHFVAYVTGGEDALAAALKITGDKANLSADTLTMLEAIGKAHVWVVMPADQFRNDLQQMPPMPGGSNPKLADAFTTAVRGAKAFAIWVKVQGKEVKIYLGMQCTDKKSASNLIGELNREWKRTNKKELEKNAGMLGPIGDLVKQVIDSLDFDDDGAVAMVSIKLKIQTLEQVVQMGLDMMGNNPDLDLGGRKPPGPPRFPGFEPPQPPNFPPGLPPGIK